MNAENRDRYVMRDETFGGTLFDRKLLKHKFLHASEIQTGVTTDGCILPKYEHWQANTSNIRTDIPYAPTRIYFETTLGCNLRCEHCFNASGPKGPNEMETPEVISVLNALRRDNIFDVRFTGGEVTTRENWHTEIQHAKDIGLAVSINTNGVYRDPADTINKLAAINPDQVTISIDGNEEHHNKNRGKGTYAKSLESMRALKQHGVVLRTNTVLTTLSVEDAEDVINNVGPYVDEMAFFHMRMTGRAKGIQNRMLDFYDLADFSNQMNLLQQKYPDIRIFFGERAIQENSVMPNEFGLHVGSPDGTTRMNLLSDGSIWAGGYTAYIDRSLRIGNLRDEPDQSILRMWRESSLLDWYRKFGRDFMERCFTCPEFKNRCPGVNVEMELIRLNDPEIGNPNCIY